MSKNVYPKRFALYFDWDDLLLCGSDAYLPLDARYSIKNTISYVMNHKRTTELVSKGSFVAGFRICTGTILNPIYLTNLIYVTKVDPRYKLK
jgi:hypothetical protein